MKYHHIYPNIIIRHTDKGSIIQTLHPLHSIRSKKFVKKITGNHWNYWNDVISYSTEYIPEEREVLCAKTQSIRNCQTGKGQLCLTKTIIHLLK